MRLDYVVSGAFPYLHTLFLLEIGRGVGENQRTLERESSNCGKCKEGHWGTGFLVDLKSAEMSGAMRKKAC